MNMKNVMIAVAAVLALGGLYFVSQKWADKKNNGSVVIQSSNTGVAGVPCSGNEDCRSGVCRNYKCAASCLPSGHECQDDGQCCGEVGCIYSTNLFLGQCSDGLKGSPCYGDCDCQSGNCVFVSSNSQGPSQKNEVAQYTCQ